MDRRAALKYIGVGSLGVVVGLAGGDFSGLFRQKETTNEFSVLVSSPTEVVLGPLTISTNYASSIDYQNLGDTGDTVPDIREPAQLLSIKSNEPNGFMIGGARMQELLFNLTPLELSANPNATLPAKSVMLDYQDSGQWIGDTFPLTASLRGRASSSATSQTVEAVTFTKAGQILGLNEPLYGVNSIMLSRVLPGRSTVYVGDGDDPRYSIVAWLESKELQAMMAPSQEVSYYQTHQTEPQIAIFGSSGQNQTVIALTRTDASPVITSEQRGFNQRWFNLIIGDKVIGIDDNPSGVASTPTFVFENVARG